MPLHNVRFQLAWTEQSRSVRVSGHKFLAQTDPVVNSFGKVCESSLFFFFVFVPNHFLEEEEGGLFTGLQSNFICACVCVRERERERERETRYWQSGCAHMSKCDFECMIAWLCEKVRHSLQPGSRFADQGELRSARCPYCLRIGGRWGVGGAHHIVGQK